MKHNETNDYIVMACDIDNNDTMSVELRESELIVFETCINEHYSSIFLSVEDAKKLNNYLSASIEKLQLQST